MPLIHTSRVCSVNYGSLFPLCIIEFGKPARHGRKVMFIGCCGIWDCIASRSEEIPITLELGKMGEATNRDDRELRRCATSPPK